MECQRSKSVIALLGKQRVHQNGDFRCCQKHAGMREISDAYALIREVRRLSHGRVSGQELVQSVGILGRQ